MQRALAVCNAALPVHRQMTFRIGINLGDVVVEQGRLYGDAVNLAARLEGLAEGGGICISGTVYDQVATTLALRYVSLGKQVVKNIATPVRVYRIQVGPEVTPTRGRMTWSYGLTRWQRAGLIAAAVLLLLALAAAMWHVMHRPALSPAEEAAVAQMRSLGVGG
jgi:adenylate cyclase